jgi:DNA repair exonuclease SbcCD ATPase subunit
MKTIILSLLLILTVSFSFGQPKEKYSINKKVAELADSMNHLNKQIQVLNDKVKVLDDKKEMKNQILEERLEQASNTVENLTSQIHSYGVLIVILTLIVAIIGIVMPLNAARGIKEYKENLKDYKEGIKAYKEELKDHIKDIHGKITEVLVNKRDEEIDDVVKNFRSENKVLKNVALNYLLMTQHQGFTDHQLFKLFNILKSKHIDDGTKTQIAYAISKKESEYLTDYFKEAINNKSSSSIKYPALQYIATFEIDGYLKIFRDFLAGSKDKIAGYIDLIGSISSTSMTDIEVIKELLNDKELINTFNKDGFKARIADLLKKSKDWGIDDKEFDQTYLGQRLIQGNL